MPFDMSVFHQLADSVDERLARFDWRVWIRRAQLILAKVSAPADTSGTPARRTGSR
jgi:hypothetical protein